MAAYRQCHLCGYIETLPTAKYCRQCGQEFIIPPIIPTKECVIAVLSYCTIIGLGISALLDNKSAFVNYHRNCSAEAFSYAILLCLASIYMLFISDYSWWIQGVVGIGLFVCLIIFPIIGIVYMAQGIFKSFNSGWRNADGSYKLRK